MANWFDANMSPAATLPKQSPNMAPLWQLLLAAGTGILGADPRMGTAGAIGSGLQGLMGAQQQYRQQSREDRRDKMAEDQFKLQQDEMVAKLAEMKRQDDARKAWRMSLQGGGQTTTLPEGGPMGLPVMTTSKAPVEQQFGFSIPPAFLHGLENVDPEQGMALLTGLYGKDLDRKTQAERYKVEDAFKEKSFAADQANRQQSLGLQAANLGIDRERLKLQQQEAAKKGIYSPEQLTAAGRMTDDLEKIIAPARVAADGVRRVQSGYDSGNAAGDLTMVYGFMKLLDPNSVVRESEYATAENARGVPETVRNLYNRLIDGERLAPGQRDQFLKQSYDLWGKAKIGVDQATSAFSERAQRMGIDPRDVITPFGEDIKAPEIKPETTLPDAPSRPSANELKSAPSIKSDADYEALAPGALFYDPEGHMRRKPAQ